MPGQDRCGAISAHFKVTCDLEPGHVMSADDWHEGHAETTTAQKSSTYEVTSVVTETARWAPMSWEIPKVAAGHEGEVR